MAKEMLIPTSIAFLIGMLFLAISYTTLILPDSVWADILRQLGVALVVASFIAVSIDLFFQQHLVEKTKTAARDAAVLLEKDVSRLGKDVAETRDKAIDVLRGVPIMFGCLQSGIFNIYRSRFASQERIIELLGEAKDHVELMGISLRTFFQGGADLNRAVTEILIRPEERDTHSAKWRVLVLDPSCEQAKLRSAREEIKDTPYEESTLKLEVETTIKKIGDYRRVGGAIELKTYYGAPCCFLLIVDDVMFIEQYHYGKEGGKRASELVPLLEFRSESNMYKELLGHFNYMWENLSRDPYTKTVSVEASHDGTHKKGEKRGGDYENTFIL